MQQKPFYSKTKLLYQTKINLWGYDELHLSQKLKKKKWDFLKFKDKKNFNKNILDTFRFNPLAKKSSFGRLKNNFKSNLYLKKLVRLKYGRLKNKEFYNIFRKHKGYKELIARLGSRLDVSLFPLLFPISIFKLRQKILHGKILLNGQKIKSPNIFLKRFDVISLKFSDFSNKNFLYQNTEEQVSYYTYIAFRLFHLINFKDLDDELKSNFIKELSSLLGKDSYKDALNEFFTEEFNFLSLGVDPNENSIKKRKVLSKLDLPCVINILNKKYIYQNIQSFIKKRKENLEISNISSFSQNEIEQEFSDLGFFNNSFNPQNFEVKFNGDFLDIVFLGFSKKSINYKNNDQFALHYLYY